MDTASIKNRPNVLINTHARTEGKSHKVSQTLQIKLYKWVPTARLLTIRHIHKAFQKAERLIETDFRPAVVGRLQYSYMLLNDLHFHVVIEICIQGCDILLIRNNKFPHNIGL